MRATRTGMDTLEKKEAIFELKALLALPMESNYDLLMQKFKEMASEKVVEQTFVEAESTVEEAPSLEDLFNGFT